MSQSLLFVIEFFVLTLRFVNYIKEIQPINSCKSTITWSRQRNNCVFIFTKTITIIFSKVLNYDEVTASIHCTTWIINYMINKYSDKKIFTFKRSMATKHGKDMTWLKENPTTTWLHHAITSTSESTRSTWNTKRGNTHK